MYNLSLPKELIVMILQHCPFRDWPTTIANLYQAHTDQTPQDITPMLNELVHSAVKPDARCGADDTPERILGRVAALLCSHTQQSNFRWRDLAPVGAEPLCVWFHRLLAQLEQDFKNDITLPKSWTVLALLETFSWQKSDIFEQTQHYRRSFSHEERLFCAVWLNHASKVKQWLRHDHVSVQYTDQLGRGLLHIAAQQDHVETLEALIECRAVQPLFDRQCATPLHLAANAGHLKSTQTLLRYGFRLDKADEIDWTPWKQAVMSGQTHWVKKYLHLYPVLCKQQDSTGQSAIHWAATWPVAVELLKILSKFNNVFARDAREQTALHIACQFENEPAVKYLLHAPFGMHLLSVQDVQGYHALHRACQHQKSTILESILAQLARNGELQNWINVRNHRGQTPLHLSTSSHMTRRLLKCGADPVLKDLSGQFALQQLNIAILKALQSRIQEKGDEYRELFSGFLVQRHFNRKSNRKVFEALIALPLLQHFQTGQLLNRLCEQLRWAEMIHHRDCQRYAWMIESLLNRSTPVLLQWKNHSGRTALEALVDNSQGPMGIFRQNASRQWVQSSGFAVQDLWRLVLKKIKSSIHCSWHCLLLLTYWWFAQKLHNLCDSFRTMMAAPRFRIMPPIKWNSCVR